MNGDARVTVRWTVLALVALALVGVGAGAAYLGLRKGSPAQLQADSRSGMPGMGQPAAKPEQDKSAAVRNDAPLPDVIVTLSQDAVSRAGITAAPVTVGTASAAIRAPGVIEPNAYKQVTVTPLVSGRVTAVPVVLGERVHRGQTMAQVFSPELAEAQTRYVSVRAELDAHERELARTEKLVEIGAASRQELERLHAEHTARRADVESAESRLHLLGLSPDAIANLGPGKSPGDATNNVPAPITGVVTERLANIGLNVDLATKLFTVVDLSTVWVVADLYEKDFARVHIGNAARITTTAYPDLVLQGRVSYIDPQVSQDTRTAKLRIEVPNLQNQLRLGMYAEASFASEGGPSVPIIPRTAVQNVGDRTVVYLVNPKEPGTFIEREVRLGDASGDRVAVLAGVKPGDLVVNQGSFYVRAELEWLGLRGTVVAR
jgi:cobalt-zinc-cadmium efflux system membrane fusion protein